jgi:hypothetical protein
MARGRKQAIKKEKRMGRMAVREFGQMGLVAPDICFRR